MDEGRSSIPADDLYQRPGSAVAPMSSTHEGDREPIAFDLERQRVPLIRQHFGVGTSELLAFAFDDPIEMHVLFECSSGRPSNHPASTDEPRDRRRARTARRRGYHRSSRPPRSRRQTYVRWGQIEIRLPDRDGKALRSAQDGTFANAGKVALWTKADSVTYFDTISIMTFK
jgi:hypothetical protein